MLKWIRRFALALLALLLIAVFVAWWLVRGSLPQLEGDAALTGLANPVTVQRDANGTVTIDAASEADALRALGYVHAQERFFEMDLLRRTAAGELSALFGPIAVDTDKKRRVHRMRARVQRDLATITGNKGPQLQAYVEGVNAGLGALRTRPWPYLLLQQAPAVWTAADTPLAGYAMYFDLQDGSNARELALWRMRPHLPAPLYALLARDGTRWDAPLMGEARGDAVLPDAATLDLRRLPAPTAPAPGQAETKGTPGSNNFAVSGALTADGRAIVADDMHLGLRAPNIWFRARLRYPDPAAPGGKVDVQGFTLPGLPGIIVGSNGHVAWGFTNSYGDYLDWKLEKPCMGARPVAETGSEPCVALQTHLEHILVKGADPVAFEVRETAWGPILHEEEGGKALALRWTAHQPGSVNLGISGFARAADLDDALALADDTAVPTQNLVIGDASGRIAWRLLGPQAIRSNECADTFALASPPEAAEVSASACAPWSIATNASTTLRAPQADRLWTANARTLDGEALRTIGDGGYAFGARAHQIRERLHARQRFSERDLLAVQLDDRAVLLTPWWKLLREQAARTRTTAMAALSEASTRWEGRASTDSVSYRLVRAWRLAVHARIADGLTAPAQSALGGDFVMPDLPQLEGVAWPLVTQRPSHLLSRRYASWDALFEDAAKEVRDGLAEQGPLAQRTWGERNTAAICHPLAGAIPLLGKRLLCMPPDPLPGDGSMPRVQGPAFGASERMVVSPGHEAHGIAHMPGGQSGHFLSPYWGAGHDDWVCGKPSPFLPGKAQHTLTLAGP